MKRLKGYMSKLGWFNGLKLYINRKRNKKGSFKVEVPDISHPIYLRHNSADFAVFEQIFINFEYAYDYEECVKVIVDAGANIGLAAIYFANRFPQAKIIAIEPESSNYEMLLKNTSAYKNVIAVKKGLWSKDCFLKITDTNVESHAFQVEETTEKNGAIDATTVPTLINEFELAEIDILKIDIEGSEREIFSNGVSWLSQIKLLIIELHDNMKSGCSRSFFLATDKYTEDEVLIGENYFIKLNS